MAQNDFKTENESRPALIRAMGRWDLTAVGVNQVIGSGMFIMPATVAATQFKRILFHDSQSMVLRFTRIDCNTI